MKNVFDINIALAFLNSKLGQKYDHKGIVLSQVFNLDSHDKKKYFCSELISECLKIAFTDKEKQDYFFSLENYQNYSPERLYEYLKQLNLLSDV